MRIFILVLSLFICLQSFADVTASNYPTKPSFAINSVGGFTVYNVPETLSTSIEFSDNKVWARVAKVGDYEFELSMIPQQDINDFWFPWQQNAATLNGSIDDDIVFYPLWSGLAKMASATPQWAWEGYDYPSAAFSPIITVKDNTKAYTVCATNWPPKQVNPRYSLGRVAFNYQVILKTGVLYTYRVMIVPSDTWQFAADIYSTWLNQNMRDEKMYPIKYPNSQQRSNGWINIQLENYTEFKPSDIMSFINEWSPNFSRVQFWGQMSNYSGDPIFAKPPLQQGELTGCCLASNILHSRYLGLQDIVQSLEMSNIDVGFYIRSRDEGTGYGKLDDPTIINGKTHLQFIMDWIKEIQTEIKGNCIYFDVFGGQYVGSGLYPATLLKSVLPHNTVIEGLKDFYPTAFLISGHITGIGQGGLNKTIKNLGTQYDTVTYPEFGRFILGDRIVYLGQSNNDWQSFGATHDYWIEREAFLLGAKLDINTFYDNPANPHVMNRAVQMILNEWNRVGWWARNPIYRGDSLLTNVPDGIRISRFIDKDSKQLFVIENWTQLTNQIFKFRTTTVNVPTNQLSIVELP